MKNIFLFGILFGLAFVHQSVAASKGSSATKGVYASVGMVGLRSTIGSDNDSTVKNREMYTWGGDIYGGYRLGRFILGAGGEYSKWNQDTGVATVGNTNVQGTKLAVGPFIGYDLGHIDFIARYNLYNQFSLENKNAAGQAVKYLGATNTYDVQLRYQIKEQVYVGLAYSYTQYKKTSVDDSVTDLSSGAEMNFVGYGFSLGFTL